MPELLPALDLEATLMRLGGDVELLITLYDAYLEDTPRKLHQLATVIEENNLAEAMHIAHTLKGSSSTVGALRVSSTAQALENACREKKCQDIRNKYDLLTTHFQRAKQAISEHKGKFSACN